MRHSILMVLFFFTVLLCSAINVQSYDDTPIDQNDMYWWHGDYPNIANVSPQNNSVVNNNSVLVSWSWWDDFTIGYGYIKGYSIVINNSIVIMQNNTFQEILTAPTNFTLNITSLGFSIGQKIAIFISLTYHIEGHWKFQDHIGNTNATIIYSYNIPEEPMEFFSTEYIPYFIGGLGLIIGLVIVQYYIEYRKTVKGLKRREEIG